MKTKNLNEIVKPARAYLSRKNRNNLSKAYDENSLAEQLSLTDISEQQIQCNKKELQLTEAIESSGALVYLFYSLRNVDKFLEKSISNNHLFDSLEFVSYEDEKEWNRENKLELNLKRNVDSLTDFSNLRNFISYSSLSRNSNINNFLMEASQKYYSYVKHVQNNNESLNIDLISKIELIKALDAEDNINLVEGHSFESDLMYDKMISKFSIYDAERKVRAHTMLVKNNPSNSSYQSTIDFSEMRIKNHQKGIELIDTINCASALVNLNYSIKKIDVFLKKYRSYSEDIKYLDDELLSYDDRKNIIEEYKLDLNSLKQLFIPSSRNFFNLVNNIEKSNLRSNADVTKFLDEAKIKFEEYDLVARKYKEDFNNLIVKH